MLYIKNTVLKLQVFPAVVRELNSQDQSKLQNYGSIKNYNSEFHAQKQSSGSLMIAFVHETRSCSFLWNRNFVKNTVCKRVALNFYLHPISVHITGHH